MFKVSGSKDNRLSLESPPVIGYYFHRCVRLDGVVWSFKYFPSHNRRCALDTAKHKLHLAPLPSRESLTAMECVLVVNLLRVVNNGPIAPPLPIDLSAEVSRGALKLTTVPCCGSEHAQKQRVYIAQEPLPPLCSAIWWEWFSFRGRYWSVWRISARPGVAVDFKARRVILGPVAGSVPSSERKALRELAHAYNNTRGDIASVVMGVLAFLILFYVVPR